MNNKDFEKEALNEQDRNTLNEKLKECESVSLPKSLTKEEIENKIKDVKQNDYREIVKEPKKKGNSRRKTVLKGVSVAAVIAIAFTSLLILTPFTKKPSLKPSKGEEKPQATVQSRDDYKEIEKLFIDLSKKIGKKDIYNSIIGGAATDKPESSQEADQNNAGEDLLDSSDKNYGETNEQVLGVNEADIIKNDGKYIYCVGNKADWDKFYSDAGDYQQFNENQKPQNKETTALQGEASPEFNPQAVSTTKKEGKIKKPELNYEAVISIFEPQKDGKIKRSSKINITAPKSDVFNIEIAEIYVTGNRLLVISQCYMRDESNYNVDDVYICGADNGLPNSKIHTLTICYDITDRENPKESYRLFQSGSYISSRLIGNSLVNLTNYRVNLESTKEKIAEECVPLVGDNYNQMLRVPARDIEIMDKVNDSSYLVASNMDITDKASIKTKAVLGGGDNVYCTTENLYVASANYNYYTFGKLPQSVDSYTEIYKFDIKNFDIKFLKKGKVKGTALNQFSIDEYKGNLRIATTIGDFDNNLKNSVYILDKDLNEIGKLENIAKGEMIKSVRFSGDIGYVVTFMETDPLFVIDLKNPQKPQIMGEIKIPGFSAYLHPIDENLVLGIGFDGDEMGSNGKIKLSLFDVSNPLKPYECDKYILEASKNSSFSSCYSDAVFNHKAICFDEENNRLLLPFGEHIESFNNENGENIVSQYGGILSIKIDTEKKAFTNSHISLTEPKESVYITGFNRVTYIDDIVFGFSQYENYLVSFQKDGEKPISKVSVF